MTPTSAGWRSPRPRTTPRSSRSTRAAFPYGGVELARFFDGDQRIAANIGGRPPAAFGVVVHDRRSGHETASQRGRMHPDLAHPPIRLVDAPRGAGAHPRRLSDAGLRGPVPPARSRRLHLRSRRRDPHAPPLHRRLRADVWRVLPVGPERSGHDVRVLFPSTGSDVTVTAGLRDGRELPIGRVRGSRSTTSRGSTSAVASCGYVVVLRSRPAARPRTPHPPARRSPARRTPARRSASTRSTTARLRDLTVSARIAPARALEDARQLARRLGARPSFLRTASDVPR